MKIYSIPTDGALRSTLSYGTEDYPFAFFLDEIEAYDSRCVEWHWHREFEFSLAVKDEVYCRIADRTLRLEKGSGLFINSRTIHRFEAENGGAVANMVFLPEFIAAPDSLLFQKYVLPILSAGTEYRVYPAYDPAYTRILECASQIRETMDIGMSGRELHLRNLISELWEDICLDLEAVQTESLPRGSRLSHGRLQTMLNYIHEHYHEHVGLDDIAASANISRTEALRCFRAGVQTSPVSYLNDYRLHRARERLLSTNDTVTSTAFAVGFESAGYFCRAFRKEFGRSPNELRRNPPGRFYAER